MNALRSSIISLALCSLFASSLVRADDCSDALIAESCACRSVVPSEREQRRSSDEGSVSDRQLRTSKGASSRVAQRAKMTSAPSDKVMPKK
jgi:hypothetical protein